MSQTASLGIYKEGFHHCIRNDRWVCALQYYISMKVSVCYMYREVCHSVFSGIIVGDLYISTGVSHDDCSSFRRLMGGGGESEVRRLKTYELNWAEYG